MLRTFIDVPKEDKIVAVSPTPGTMQVSGTITKDVSDPNPTFWAAVVVKTPGEVGSNPGSATPRPITPPGTLAFSGLITLPTGLNGSDTEELPPNYLAVFAASGTSSSLSWSPLADVKEIKGVRLDSARHPIPEEDAKFRGKPKSAKGKRRRKAKV